MVSIQSNTIRLEVRVSYQFAIDAQQAVKRLAVSTRNKARAVKSSALDTAQAGKRRTVKGFQQFGKGMRQVPPAVRDRVVGFLLGIPADRVERLRELAVNGVAVQATVKKPAVRTVKPVALDKPETGANVDAVTLRNALERLKACVNRHIYVPILGHVHIEPANKGKALKLTTTDLEVGATITIPAAVRDLKACCIPIASLLSAIKGAKGSISIDLEQAGDDQNAVLTIGSRTVRLLTLPAEEYPLMPTIEGDYQQVSGLIPAIKRVSMACSTDETRYILTGISMQADRIATTDGHRLHCAKIANGPASDIILPGRAATMLGKVLAATDEPLSMRISGSQAEFMHGDCVLYSRLIEGMFPNIDKVTPKEFSVSFEVVPCALVEAINGLANVAKENSDRTRFEIKDGIMTITAESGNVGKATAEVAVTGDDLRVVFNYRYLLDAIAAFPGASKLVFERQLYTNEANPQYAIDHPEYQEQQPWQIRAANDDQVFVVLMPMQID